MKRISILLTIFILLISSCSDDFLERTSLTSLAEDNFWNNEADAELALMGAYSALQSQWLFNSGPWGGGMTRLDYLSDDGFTSWQWMAGGDIARGEHNSTSWMIGSMWSDAYRAIGRANQVIEKVPEIEDITPEAAAKILAEAKVIRATVYNILAMTYKDVPLVAEPIGVKDSEIPKNSQQEIVDFIISDLEGVVDNLPVDAPHGRITKGVALAMLARINLWHNNYDEAAEYAKQVIDLDKYSLFDDYSTLFTAENEQNDEIIFAITFDRELDDGSDFAGYWGNDFIIAQLPLPNLVDAYYMKDGLPIDESPLYNPDHKSENRDPRFAVTLVTNGDTWRGDTVKGETYEYQRKYTEEQNSENHFDSPQDFYVIRYAHVLLMRAEALVRSGSYDEAEVIGLINQIRDRVDMPKVEDVEGTGLSQQELLDIVKHERRVETAFEGLRYFDLMRWEELKEKYDWYMENELPYLKEQGYPDARKRNFEDPKHWKWPLPQGELDVNKALKQHDEWMGGSE